MKNRAILVALLAAALPDLAAAVAGQPGAAGTVQFVFTSDAHYGITRPAFRGAATVGARTVNRALVEGINALGGATFPKDGGLGAAMRVGPVDFIVEGGDTTNRAEVTPEAAIQSATASWEQFVEDYFGGLTLADRQGARSSLYVVPGNHEASNAVGFHRSMSPATDPGPMVGIFNRMMKPAVAKTPRTYDYAGDRVLWSRTVAGVHFVFLSIWPDSATRAWMTRDLSRIPPDMPVVLFTHDQPDAEAKHFKNPNPPYDINATDKFENLLADRFADGRTIAGDSTIEQSELERFISRHPNISAYFHGNSNWNQFYDWTGPNHTIALHAFRVDSPMKGAISAADETRLSFQVATIDLASRTMTVREVLWNAAPLSPSPPLTWGGSTTVGLSPRPAHVRTSTSVGGD